MPRQLQLWSRKGTSKRAVEPRTLRSSTASGRVPHSTRPKICGAAHIVLRIRRGLPSLRTPRAWRVMERCFRKGKEKEGFRLLEFSVLDDHLHMIVEASEKRRLARGLQGLMIRLAKALNRFWHRRRGSVFADRYFSLALTGRQQIYRTFRYVLQNAFKHGIWLRKNQPDPYSSARWFRRWTSPADIRRPLRSPPNVNLRSLEYLFARTIGLDELPGPRHYDDSETLDLASY